MLALNAHADQDLLTRNRRPAMSSTLIFKIVSAQAWADACAAGRYLGSDDDRRDGFIHFSAADQVAATFTKYFSDQTHLLLVAFDAERLDAQLKWEPSRGGALFPHYYGALSTELARWARPIPDDAARRGDAFKDLR